MVLKNEIKKNSVLNLSLRAGYSQLFKSSETFCQQKLLRLPGISEQRVKGNSALIYILICAHILDLTCS